MYLPSKWHPYELFALLIALLGDLSFKRKEGLSPAEQAITVVPEVSVTELTAEDEFMVLACDGIWEVLTSQQVVTFVRRRLDSAARITDILEQLCDLCLAPTNRGHKGTGLGMDNMTAMIVKLKKK